LFVGSVYGKKDRDRPKTRYSNNIKERAATKSIVAIHRLAQDRDKWQMESHGGQFVCLPFNNDNDLS